MTGNFIMADCQLAPLISYTKPENNCMSPAHRTSLCPCCDIFRYNLHRTTLRPFTLPLQQRSSWAQSSLFPKTGVRHFTWIDTCVRA